MTVAPQNLQAEENVIGAILMSPHALEACIDHVKPDDFYRKSHGLIFEQACRLAEEGIVADPLTVGDALEARGKLGAIGGQQKLHELAALTPSTSNAAHHARIVADQAALRRLDLAGRKIAKLAEDRPGSTDELLAEAESLLSQAISPSLSGGFTPLAEEMDEVVREIELAIETGELRKGLGTGFLDLDKKLRGFFPGTLNLIAARPSMGKSALAQNIAENVADAGHTSAIVSLEMSKEEMIVRSISRASGINSVAIREGRLNEQQVVAFRGGVETVKARGQRFHFEDRTDINPTTLRAELQRLQRRHKVDLLVVDYLQLMLSSRGEDSRQQEISSISRSLKLLAKDIGIPIIALSQLNRQLERRDEKRPQLSDLRDSGSLEQDADTVLFIYRDDYYNADSQAQGIAEVIIAKNRMGQMGPHHTAKLAFVGRTTEFKNLAQGVNQ